MRWTVTRRSPNGPAYGLPPSISGADSYWYRDYTEPPPEAPIVVGLSPDTLSCVFTSCDVAGQVTNQYGVKNEETSHPGFRNARWDNQHVTWLLGHHRGEITAVANAPRGGLCHVGYWLRCHHR
jgi:hypothetical protein